ncbi:Hypothetical predicted protein [Pelobates cultripes]|uniref:Uncharacterized protein n=1 Tax=Pelobates cultripes TaxID=61616 RepID=A0AAD1TJU0_PELCU|nr:Hypothetical predicted protein [Pelobates cultripes]
MALLRSEISTQDNRLRTLESSAQNFANHSLATDVVVSRQDQCCGQRDATLKTWTTEDADAISKYEVYPNLRAQKMLSGLFLICSSLSCVRKHQINLNLGLPIGR